MKCFSNMNMNVQLAKTFFLMEIINAFISHYVHHSVMQLYYNCDMFLWFFLDDQWKSHSIFSRRQEEDWLRPGIWAGGRRGLKERAATENVWKEPGRRGLGTRAWRERGVDLIDPKNPGVAAGTRSCFFSIWARENWMQFCLELYIINAIIFYGNTKCNLTDNAYIMLSIQFRQVMKFGYFQSPFY